MSASRRRFSQRIHKERKEKGLCVGCGKVRDRKPLLTCSVCARKHKERLEARKK